MRKREKFLSVASTLTEKKYDDVIMTGIPTLL
jgi:hypothetical protein